MRAGATTFFQLLYSRGRIEIRRAYFGLVCLVIVNHNRAKVAAMAATPGCSQAHNLGHSKECLPAQHNFAAQHNFVAYHRNSVAQHNFMVQRNLVTQHKFVTQHNFEAKYNFI